MNIFWGYEGQGADSQNTSPHEAVSPEHKSHMVDGIVTIVHASSWWTQEPHGSGIVTIVHASPGWLQEP